LLPVEGRQDKEREFVAHQSPLAENLGLFDFELAADEMAAITAQNCNHRFNDPAPFARRPSILFVPSTNRLGPSDDHRRVGR
jgi:hypothetical protein